MLDVVDPDAGCRGSRCWMLWIQMLDLDVAGSGYCIWIWIRRMMERMLISEVEYLEYSRIVQIFFDFLQHPMPPMKQSKQPVAEVAGNHFCHFMSNPLIFPVPAALELQKLPECVEYCAIPRNIPNIPVNFLLIPMVFIHGSEPVPRNGHKWPFP